MRELFLNNTAFVARGEASVLKPRVAAAKTPDPSHCILSFFAPVQKWQQVLRIRERMLAEGVSPNEITSYHFVSAMHNTGRHAGIKECYDQLVATGVKV